VSLLEGKVAIVTGAARGVGRGHAFELARQGALVLVNDLGSSVDGTGCSREADLVVAQINSHGGVALADYGDVGDEAQVEQMFAKTLSAWGKVDIIVNNAGNLRDAPITEMTTADFDDVLRVHARGSWLTCRAAARLWERAADQGQPSYGRIINTTSGVGMAGNVRETNYVTAKAAVIGLTLALHMELGRAGITCNAIGPSGNTRMALNAGTNSGALVEPEIDIDSAWSRYDPSNSSPLVAWLASPEAGHVSGQVFRCYGGRIALMSGWYELRGIENGGTRWDADELGTRLGEELFQTRSPGWPRSLSPR
jgi:NAD(P)-dependent dehydrogenase (short-subunit alcohol dehydrogenase family)